MKGKVSIFILLVFILSAMPGYTTNKEGAQKIINSVENLIKKIETKDELKPYIPFDVYSEALLNVTYARNMLDAEKYLESYYFAAASLIRFETAIVTAEGRKNSYTALKMERDYYKEHGAKKDTGLGDKAAMIIEANLLKKGPVYRIQFYDRQLFKRKKSRLYYKLNNDAMKKLDNIIAVLKNYTGSKIKIVGHTDKFDYKNYSKEKAAIIARYLIKNSVPKERIQIIGMGNKDVIYTHIGFRRVSRIELIISGLE